MEQKSWFWKRKSSAILIEEEKDRIMVLERVLGDLNEQLSFAQADLKVKDELLAEQAKKVEEVTEGFSKLEAEAASLKQKFDEVFLEKRVSEERVVRLEVSLNETIEKLHTAEAERLKIASDGRMNISKLHEKNKILEKRLFETNYRLAEISAQNSSLSEILEIKAKLVEDLNEYKIHAEASFATLLSRLDSSEKLNASLKYEIVALQRELDTQNMDRKFSLKSAEIVHRNHLESLKKITKLETECRRLRTELRKQQPHPPCSPSAFTRMRDPVGSPGSFNFGENSRKISSLEEENRVLKEALSKKSSELQSSWAMCARAASKLSRAESLLEEFSRSHQACSISHEALHDYNNEDSISHAESWASALLSELDHFRIGNPTTPSSKTTRTSEVSLMDDFVEMEKLAIVRLENQEGENSATGLKEINQEILLSSGKSERDHSWLEDILRDIVQKQKLMQTCPDLILQEVKIALESGDPSTEILSSKSLFADEGSVPQKFRTVHSDSLDKFVGKDFLGKETSEQSSHTSLEKGLQALIDSMKEIVQRAGGNNDHDRGILSGRTTCLFLFERAELIDISQKFTCVCLDALNRKADLKELIFKLNSTLDWLIRHCHMIEDFASLKEIMTAYSEGPESPCENKANIGRNIEAIPSSEKLAQCQKTILSLGKQMKELTFPSQGDLVSVEPREPQTPENITAISVKSDSRKSVASLLQLSWEETGGSVETSNFSASSRFFTQSSSGAIVLRTKRSKGRFTFVKRLLTRRKSTLAVGG